MKGFTLIELSVALSVLAMVAMVMLPRFAQLQRTARIGYLRGLRGSVVTVASMSHLALLARTGQRDALPCAGGGVADNALSGDGTQCIPTGLVRVHHAYPASSLSGIASAAGLGVAPTASAAQRLAGDYRIGVAGNVTTFERADADQPERCSFTYTQALDARTAASISVPVVSGC